MRVHDLELAAQQIESLDARILQLDADARQADAWVAAGHAVSHYTRVAAAKRATKDRLEILAGRLHGAVHPAAINGTPQEGVPDKCEGCDRYLPDGITWARGGYCEACFDIGLGVKPQPSPPAGEKDILDLLDRL